MILGVANKQIYRRSSLQHVFNDCTFDYLQHELYQSVNLMGNFQLHVPGRAGRRSKFAYKLMEGPTWHDSVTLGVSL